MPFQMRYPKTLTLPKLNRRTRNDEGAAGSVTRIGHSKDETLADFDGGVPPDGQLLLAELKVKADEKREGHTLICKGEVWVESELKTVGAFRAS